LDLPASAARTASAGPGVAGPGNPGLGPLSCRAVEVDASSFRYQLEGPDADVAVDVRGSYADRAIGARYGDASNIVDVSIAFDSTYSQATLGLTVNGLGASVVVQTDSFTPADLAPFAPLLAPVQGQPVVDLMQCQPDRFGDHDEMMLLASEVCPGVSPAQNLLQSMRSLLLCQEGLSGNGSTLSGLADPGSEQQLLWVGYLAGGAIIGGAIVFLAGCGGCSWGCSCVCC
jgi:hypothetical protein